MKTSYFAHYKGTNGVAITYALPSWSKYKHYLPLAPTRAMVEAYKSGRLSEEEYTRQYYKLLELRGITPQQVLKDLGDDAVLLCFEKTGKFCHRHLAAKWLCTGGVVIDELL